MKGFLEEYTMLVVTVIACSVIFGFMYLIFQGGEIGQHDVSDVVDTYVGYKDVEGVPIIVGPDYIEVKTGNPITFQNEFVAYSNAESGIDITYSMEVQNESSIDYTTEGLYKVLLKVTNVENLTQFREIRILVY